MGFVWKTEDHVLLPQPHVLEVEGCVSSPLNPSELMDSFTQLEAVKSLKKI